MDDDIIVLYPHRCDLCCMNYDFVHRGGKMVENETYLAQQIRASENIQADLSCKKILSATAILAYILKEIIPEYNNCSLEQIERLIEPDSIRL